MSVLSINSISAKFGGVVAVDNISLSVEPGEILGVIGPNGAGKTTLLNLVSGLLKPRSGTVRLGNELITGCAPDVIARMGLARTFQTSRLFPGLSIIENLMVGLHLKSSSNLIGCGLLTHSTRAEERRLRECAMNSLEFVGFADFADRPADALSFGQQRIVEIARALIAEPKIVLLDEPAVGLSISRVSELEMLLRRIRTEKQITLIMIEHVIRLVMGVCDRIAVMEAGRKIAEGPPAEIRQNQAVIDAYLGRRRHA